MFPHRSVESPLSGYPLLEGIRVLEVAQLAPASLGGHLADLGAEVIKVESGPVGDGSRLGGAQAVGGPEGPGFLHSAVEPGQEERPARPPF